MNHLQIDRRCCALLGLVVRFLAYCVHVYPLAIRHAYFLHLTARLSGLRPNATHLWIHTGLLHLDSFSLNLACR